MQNNQPFIPFARPEIGEDEILEVTDSLRSGWVTTGPKTKRFEADFSSFLGGNIDTIAVNSATAGLHLALEALGVGKGDEVILPSYTFTATAEVVRYLGATPVIVDVLEGSFNISPEAIKSAITDKTKVIIPVHFAGLSCDMEAILSIARANKLKVVEDAAHAFPATCGGRLIGTLDSDVTVFSFYANKTMTTGEGGMLVTRSSDIAKRCRIMRLHGINHDAFDRYTSDKPAWYYEVVAPGYKYNMSDIAASIGIHQLKKLNQFQQKRQALAKVYDEQLKGLPLILPLGAEDSELHAWHLYPIRLSPQAEISRDRFIEELFENGVGCSVHFIPLHLQPYWKESCDLMVESFPVSQRLFEQEVSIPLYTSMSTNEQQRVIEVITRVLSGG